MHSPRNADLLDEGQLRFTIDSRIVRELGERLVKKPEVALIELVKNAYDAEATTCTVSLEADCIDVVDDGHGMTYDEFTKGWMRVGTAIKTKSRTSRRFHRAVTGEKGIGRFAARFLGGHLHLETVADDSRQKVRTLLTADFDWPELDEAEDLGEVRVPYRLTRAGDRPSGTALRINQLSPQIAQLKLDSVRTAFIGMLTPYRSLLRTPDEESVRDQGTGVVSDPGFDLKISPSPSGVEEDSVAGEILKAAVLRAVLESTGERLALKVFARGNPKAVLSIQDRYISKAGPIYADIRFFPKRPGTYAGLSVDGRRARKWVGTHSGVAVFDRAFRVHPYGDENDDWLRLAADAAKRHRSPRSPLAEKHFPMDEPTRGSTQLNYMLRLPYPQQLIGVVEVQGQRSEDQANGGLVPAADREGFVDNDAFRGFWDLVRGAVEAIASVDRELQLEAERQEQKTLLRRLRRETRAAIKEIEGNSAIPATEKERIVGQLAHVSVLAERREEVAREREAALEVMSLLGVVAGFMTHEFGSALAELERAQEQLAAVRHSNASLEAISAKLSGHIAALKEFATYSQGYVRGASGRPEQPYPVLPRIRLIKRLFERYAADRHIDVEVDVDKTLEAPLVPVSLYSGVLLNLLTNALKAVTARSGGRRRIQFRAWNTARHHFLQVSDTGIGIPSTLRERVFDPLFTTTATRRDPLGSGMGLGLTLIKRNVETFGGKIEVIEPAEGFTTTFQIRLPLSDE